MKSKFLNLLWKAKWLLLFGVCLFLVFNRHSHSKWFDYHSVGWADAAGYYVYLPSTFIYGWDANKFPKNMDHNLGDGFHLMKDGKIITKYPCGAAILISPFFCTAHLIAKFFNYKTDGYNKIYFRSVLIAGIFYLIVGLFFSFLFLQNYLTKSIAFVTVFVIFTGTNLYYYAINSPGYSHVYSFTMFSIFMWLIDKYITQFNKIDLLYIFITYFIIIELRPINFLIGLIPLVYRINSLKDFQERLNIFLKDWKYILLFGIGSFIIILMPQLLYANYSSGDFISYSYTNESFDNLYHPKFFEVLFSPQNGWILFTPLVLFMFYGLHLLSKDYELFALTIALILLINTIIFASWWIWYFGCSFGHRCYVEWYALLALPFGLLIRRLITRIGIFSSKLLLGIVLLCILYNINAIYHYDDCWYGSSWDFKEYFRIMIKFE